MGNQEKEPTFAMNQGKIIEYINQGRFICTLCLEDKGNKLHLLTPSNREVNISPKRTILASGPTIDIVRPREDLIEKLKQIEKTRNRLKAQINVKELWELIRDEKESFDHKYLARLAFEEAITDDHLSALVRALFEDGLYFKMKENRFIPNSEERVDQIAGQKREEALREKMLAEGSAWLGDILQGKSHEDPPFREDIINLLLQLALYGIEKPDFKYGKELLSRAGITDVRESRNLLITLGVWEEDENLDLLRSNIEISFSQKQLAESERLAGAGFSLEGCEDLRNLPTLTIDGPQTRDYDDAMSLEIDGDALLLGIHIADVAEVISPENILDREARDRASSLYLPQRQIPMMPANLSQDTLSLKQGCDRRAISLLTRFESNGKLLEYRFVPSVIRVQRQLTYEEVEEILDAGTENSLQVMHQMSQHLRQKRMNQGALNISLPDLQVKFDSDSSLSLEFLDQNTPSRIIVAEFMILYNWLAASLCKDNQIPILFRAQPEPSEVFSVDECGYLYYVFRQRRKLSQLQIDTVPDPHSGLGLNVYTHATSPIRRYLDLVTQRQIKGFLNGMGPIYKENELEEIRISVAPVIKSLEKIKRNRLRYWTLKFIGQHKDEKYKALILYELKNKYRIVLIDFLLIAEIRHRNGLMLMPGQEILVRIRKVDPWNDLLELDYA